MGLQSTGLKNPQNLVQLLAVSRDYHTLYLSMVEFSTVTSALEPIHILSETSSHKVMSIKVFYCRKGLCCNNSLSSTTEITGCKRYTN